MKKIEFRLFLPGMLMLFAIVVAIAGCGKPAAPSVPYTPAAKPAPAPGPSENSFKWPDTLHFAAIGSSGEGKMVSWASVMQSQLNGPIIRIVNEAAYTNAYKDMAANKMVLVQMDKATLSDSIQANSEYAAPDGGPWPVGVVWIDSLANTGFMVRGDSNIRRPEDINPGTRIAIWNDNTGTLSPFRSLLAWGNVNEKDVIWVNTGDYNAGPRAVTSGRADICMAAPVTPAVIEASAAPGGIRYISLNPKENPDGAARFLKTSSLYEFGPITVGPKSAQGTWAIASYKYLGANLNTDAELIYNLAKWLDVNYDKYKDRYESNKNMTFNDLLAAIQTTYIPIHPGLIKYLQEKGIWDQDYERRNQENVLLLQRYIDGYKDAVKLASDQNISIKGNNPKWIELWESYKVTKKIPSIQQHISLAEDAPLVLAQPTGKPVSADSPSANTPATLPPATASEIPIEIVSVTDSHPGEDITVTIKTAPGAEVKILFTMPNGTKSSFPADNTKTAKADGIIKWTWSINSHVPGGEATFTISAKLDGKESTLLFKKGI
jgi:hypothetical protein